MELHKRVERLESWIQRERCLNHEAPLIGYLPNCDCNNAPKEEPTQKDKDRECEHKWTKYGTTGGNYCCKCWCVQPSPTKERTLEQEILDSWNGDNFDTKKQGAEYFSMVARKHYKKKFEKAREHWKYSVEHGITQHLSDALFGETESK